MCRTVGVGVGWVLCLVFVLFGLIVISAILSFPNKTMVVGELFLSAFLQVLFDKLASPDLLNFARREGVHSKIKKWEKSLLMIQAMLSDAEGKQLTDKCENVA